MYTISWKELSQILLMRAFSRENMALQLLAKMRKDKAVREEYYVDAQIQEVLLLRFWCYWFLVTCAMCAGYPCRWYY